jgi:hypothetical protein
MDTAPWDEAKVLQRSLPAHSRDGDQVFQAMVITDSSDRDQVRRRTRLTGLCVLEMASSSRLAGWFGDRSGGPWEGPVRGAECRPRATERRAREGPVGRRDDPARGAHDFFFSLV